MKKSDNSKSNDFKNRLKSYSSVAAGLAAFTPVANAQIIYTDIDPDVNISNSSYLLDLNNDGTEDFRITQNGSSSYSMDGVAVYAYQSNANKLLIDKIQFGYYSYSVNAALALNQGDTIDNNQPMWGAFGGLNAHGIYNSAPLDIGHWKSLSDKYIGFKFVIDSDLHYGWARLNVTPDATSATIKDYAYNSIPDEMIMAGQTGSAGINKYSAGNEFNVYSFNKKLVIDCGNSDIKNTVVSIFNTTGQQIKQMQINSMRTEVDMSDIPSGIYFVRLMNENGIFSRRISIN